MTQPFFCADCDSELEPGAGIQKPDGRYICPECERKLRAKETERSQGDLFTEQKTLFNPRRRVNVQGFRDKHGIFHPIRSDKDNYNEFLAGDYDTAKQKLRAKARREAKYSSEAKRDEHKAEAEYYAAIEAKEKRGQKPERSLAQFVRSIGGMTPGGMYAGEVRTLGYRETGTTGLINKHARQGSQKQTPEYVMDAANVEGFRDKNGQPYEEIGAFIIAVADSAVKGISKSGRRGDTRKQRDKKILAKAMAHNPLDKPFIISGRYASAVITQKPGEKFVGKLVPADGKGGYFPVGSGGRSFKLFRSFDGAKKWGREAVKRMDAAATGIKKNPRVRPLRTRALQLIGLRTPGQVKQAQRLAAAQRARRNPDDDSEFEALWIDTDAGTKLGDKAARTLGQTKRAERTAHAAALKLYNVTWYSSLRGRRTGFIRPIEAQTLSDAKRQAKAMITNEKAVNIVAKEVKRNPLKAKKGKPYVVTQRFSAGNMGFEGGADSYYWSPISEHSTLREAQKRIAELRAAGKTVGLETRKHNPKSTAKLSATRSKIFTRAHRLSQQAAAAEKAGDRAKAIKLWKQSDALYARVYRSGAHSEGPIGALPNPRKTGPYAHHKTLWVYARVKPGTVAAKSITNDWFLVARDLYVSKTQALADAKKVHKRDYSLGANVQLEWKVLDRPITQDERKRNPSQIAVVQTRGGKAKHVATSSGESNADLLARVNAVRVIKRINTNPALYDALGNGIAVGSVLVGTGLHNAGRSYTVLAIKGQRVHLDPHLGGRKVWVIPDHYRVDEHASRNPGGAVAEKIAELVNVGVPHSQAVAIALGRKSNPAGSSSSDVRSPTRTSTEVRSPTRTATSTYARTAGNITVTGGAGAGATTRVIVKRNPGAKNIDARLLTLAESYRKSKSASARNMIRGKAQRLINKTYTVKANRDAIWDEWRKLAGGWVANPKPSSVTAADWKKAVDTASAKAELVPIGGLTDAKLKQIGKEVCERYGIPEHFAAHLAHDTLKAVVRQPPKRRNPSTREMSERFNGRASGKVIELKAANSAPGNLARAGKLVFLKLVGAKQLRIPGAVVCIDPKTEKLWIVGDRTPLLTKKARPGERLDFGEIDRICYETAKKHIDGGRLTEYVHTFGEDGGKRPKLQVDAEGMPIIVGGDYKIKAEGIVN